MPNEYWIWKVTYRSGGTASESMVVAPDMDAVKRSVESAVAGIVTFEHVERGDSIPSSAAEQHFDGYCPRLRWCFGAIATMRTVVGRGQGRQ